MNCGTIHFWTYSGTSLPEGFPCNCGAVKWKSPSEKIKELEEKLAVAVEALEYYEKVDNGLNPANLPARAVIHVAHAALAKIKESK